MRSLFLSALVLLTACNGSIPADEYLYVSDTGYASGWEWGYLSGIVCNPTPDPDAVADALLPQADSDWSREYEIVWLSGFFEGWDPGRAQGLIDGGC